MDTAPCNCTSLHNRNRHRSDQNSRNYKGFRRSCRGIYRHPSWSSSTGFGPALLHPADGAARQILTPDAGLSAAQRELGPAELSTWIGSRI